MDQHPHLQDAVIANAATAALPNGTATTTSTLLDLQNGPAGSFQADRAEFELFVPALPAGQLPATDTIGYSIFSSPNPDGSNPRTEIIVPPLTVGATGGGAAIGRYRFRLQFGVNRYLGFTATGGQSGIAAGATTANLTIVF